VQIRELSIPDAYEVIPVQHADDRGVFLEWYRSDRLEEATGRSLALRQANTSVSRKGVVRGIHYADIPIGQAKYVTVLRGAVLDFVIDIRVGSPTYGQWDSVVLDDTDRKAIFISEALGHAFIALTDDAVVSYLVTDTFTPAREHGLSPVDAEIGLEFPSELGAPLLSEKDLAAPTLLEAAAAGKLPTWDDARAHYETLKSGS
jgi:dTDP-4-dehydrorhamnose 3,5-epimerase